DQHRRDEQRDLQARTERDGQTEFHLVLERDFDGDHMLGDVADQRDDDDADEELGQAERLGDGVNRTDQHFAQDSNDDSGDNQDDDRGADAPLAARLFFMGMMFGIGDGLLSPEGVQDAQTVQDNHHQRDAFAQAEF